MTMQEFSLSKKSRIAGLYLYCNTCKKYYANDSSINCKCRNLSYRAKIHVSGTKNKSKVKTLAAKYFNGALSELLEFKNYLISTNFQNQLIPKLKPSPVFLTDCMADYMEFLDNEGVPAHKIKIRTKGHIKDYQRNFRYYINALKGRNIDASTLRFTDIGDLHIGYVHDYLLTTRGLKNKSYNNIISALRIFTSHIIREYKLNYSNPFEGVKKRYVEVKLLSVGKTDFTELIKVVTPENGIKVLSTGERKNLYKDWLVDAFCLGLYTGGRRDEVINMKWSDIKVDRDGKMLEIEVNHYKFNKSKSDVVSENEKRTKQFLIYDDFKSFLINLGYEKYKNTDNYILAPLTNMKRETMKDFISKAFAHFIKKLNLNEKLEFKHLRKTFSTSAYIQFGNKAHIITDHSGMSIMESNYIDKKVVQNAARANFQIFNEN